MLKQLRFAFAHFLFWLIVFAVFRVFMLILTARAADFNLFQGDTLGVFWQGIRLDLSTASYLFVLPLLLLPFVGSALHNHVLKVTKGYYSIILAITTILLSANLAIFHFWGTLLNVRALEFVVYPKEMLASVSNLQIALISGFIFAVWWALSRIRRRILDGALSALPSNSIHAIWGFLLLLPISFTCIRGGWNLIPINEASAAYSSNNKLNNIALNPIWFLGNNILKSGFSNGNPYEMLTDAKAKQVTDELLENPVALSPDSLLNNPKCNVVLIMLESWTADVIEPLGGIKGVTPFFSLLANDGLLFTQTYSSGFRTDQGLTSILSGFPSIPNKSIIKFIDKTQQLPSLGRIFADAGYQSRFYYGGELGFANMNNFLLQSGFNERTEVNEFQESQRNSKWGAHDEYLFERLLSDHAEQENPFFSVVLTLSTHEPFETPRPTPFGMKSEADRFKGAAWYTDQSLKQFFDVAASRSWYKNTLFILVADHGHRLPLNRDYFEPASRRIPVLFYGEPLNQAFRGKTIDRVSSQHDLATTLMWMTQRGESKFKWSRNMFGDPANGFAYLNQDQAITWITSTDTTRIQLHQDAPSPNNTRTQQAWAYLQNLYRTFLDL
ncbi:MAG: LTA synthase family protein [Arcticibacter sp.]